MDKLKELLDKIQAEYDSLMDAKAKALKAFEASETIVNNAASVYKELKKEAEKAHTEYETARIENEKNYNALLVIEGKLQVLENSLSKV